MIHNVLKKIHEFGSRYSAISLFVFLVLTLSSIVLVPLQAETQTGYVRTIGRNGKPGKPISGVMVRADGPANMVMSDSEGQFSLLLNELGRDDAFKIATVKKANYELLDKDLIGRECGFTPVPMEIVLVNLSEMQAEKAAMAERFEQKYAETYQKKVAELQAQLEAKQITDEEYTSREEELTKALETMLAQIETMVDRYVHTDYDRLDSLDQVINAHIEMGEFDEAERLIQSKGSVEERLAALKESQEVQRQLEEAQKKLAAANNKKQESLKRDLNLLIDIAEAHLRPDSAYLYLRQLVEADPEDVKLLFRLMSNACAFEDYAQAFYYFDQADSICQKKSNTDTIRWADACAKIGYVLEENTNVKFRVKNNDTLDGFYYYKKEKDLRCEYYGGKSIKCAEQLSLFGIRIEYYDTLEAKKYYKQAIQLCTDLIANDSTDLWAQFHLCHTQFWLTYIEQTLSQADEECYQCTRHLLQKAMNDTATNDSLIKVLLREETWPVEEQLQLAFHYYPSHMNNNNDSLEFAMLINNALIYLKRHPTEISEHLVDSCRKQAIHILEHLDINWTNHQDILCHLYLFQKDYEKAIECNENILQHVIQIYGLNSMTTCWEFRDAAMCCHEAGDTTKAIQYYKEAIAITKKKLVLPTYGYGIMINSYRNLGYIYREKELYDDAIEMFSEMLHITMQFGHHIAYTEMELGRTYQEMGDKKKAKEWYQKALKVYREKKDQEGIAEAEEALAGLKKK